MDLSVGFAATLIGTAIGVIAGIFIQYFLTLALEKRSKKLQLNALTKEFIYNKAFVEELVEEAKNFRNAVNGGVFDKYFGYFQLGKALFIQANASATSGVLYEIFEADDIRNIQKVVSKLSIGTENWLNGEITRRRQAAVSSPTAFDKIELINFVDFVDKDMSDVARSINSIIKRLNSLT